MHNLRFSLRLMEDVRAAIAKTGLAIFARELIEQWDIRKLRLPAPRAQWEYNERLENDSCAKRNPKRGARRAADHKPGRARVRRALRRPWRGQDRAGARQGAALGTAEVRSPTFTIVHEYETTPKLLHFEAYRLADAEELYAIGFADYLAQTRSACWSGRERVPDALAARRALDVSLKEGGRAAHVRFLRTANATKEWWRAMILACGGHVRRAGHGGAV
jgi:tRNA A37 threonylcarbamoyladenosine biosynthesis protein TsaE